MQKKSLVFDATKPRPLQCLHSARVPVLRGEAPCFGGMSWILFDQDPKLQASEFEEFGATPNPHGLEPQKASFLEAMQNIIIIVVIIIIIIIIIMIMIMIMIMIIIEASRMATWVEHISNHVPSGKHLHNYGKIHHFQGSLHYQYYQWPFSVLFISYVKLPEGNHYDNTPVPRTMQHVFFQAGSKGVPVGSMLSERSIENLQPKVVLWSPVEKQKMHESHVFQRELSNVNFCQLMWTSLGIKNLEFPLPC